MAKVDVSQIEVSGPGLNGGKTGQKLTIYLSGAPVYNLINHVSYLVDGPRNFDVVFDSVREDGSIESNFVALEPGDYKITILYRGKEIPESPFKLKIFGESISPTKLISKVKVHGVASEIGHAYTINEFVVDCSSVERHLGALKVHIKGPPHTFAHLDVHDNKNGTYNISYKPNDPGTFVMNIKIADEDIPDSPLIIRVIESHNFTELVRNPGV